jgi:hypothetical protein
MLKNLVVVLTMIFPRYYLLSNVNASHKLSLAFAQQIVSKTLTCNSFTLLKISDRKVLVSAETETEYLAQYLADTGYLAEYSVPKDY